MRLPRTYWLSMHVPYGCRHAGACCSSGWPIPIERSRVGAVGGLRRDLSWLNVMNDAPPDIAGALALADNGHCVFHRDGCEIHRHLGEAAMPTACRHFPRQVLIDPRGVFVTLSHYCPTAADLLFRHEGSIDIVEGPAAIPCGEPEGVDARDVLPPLLAPGVLVDLDGYSAWERHVVDVLTTTDAGSAEMALDRLERDLAVLQRWRPGVTSLVHAVHALAIPPPRGGAYAGVDVEDAVVRRYLAARAFASPAAYGIRGVGGVVHSLRKALSRVRDLRHAFPLKEAIRQTDFQLLHQGQAALAR
jgi:hypothetical protein